MISLEQVQLLEARVSKAIEYVKRVNAENSALASEKAALQERLETNQKRIDELEVLVMRFKEDQGRIEDGIVAALDRLSQFEEAFEKSLKENVVVKKTPVKTREKTPEPSKEIYFDITEKETAKESEPLDDVSDDKLSLEGELDIF
jgi:FtsZ-binding cell division protein ZapB